jgi:hypothetical protein
MSMEHSAFLFDYQKFSRELRPILVKALQDQNTLVLLQWIEKHREQLVDPYEGNPLEANWEQQLPSKTVHVYGDFALTKYYDPLDSIGLEYEWIEIGEYLDKVGSREAVILGTALGPEREPFDPGGMGSYFQTEATVRSNLGEVEQLIRDNPTGLDKLQPVATMLRAAAKAERGLYVTF